MRIIGVDPGKVTGICSFIILDDKPTCIESYELDLKGVYRYFTERVGTFETLVVCEMANKFQASGHMSSEVIGIVKAICEIKAIPLKMQQSTDHKRLVKAPVLKMAGLYVRGDHARDAARLGLYWALTEMKLMQYALDGG